MNNEQHTPPAGRDTTSADDGLKGFSAPFNRRYFLFALLIIIVMMLWVFGSQIASYASSFLGAITIFVLLRGQMKRLTKKRKWRKGPAAALLVGESVIFFLIPLGAIVGMLIDIFTQSSIDFNNIYERIMSWEHYIEDRFNVQLLTLENLKNLTGVGQEVVSYLLKNVSSIAINSVLMLFILFYMLLQREAFETSVFELLPFSKSNKAILVSESKRIIVANAVGIPVLAIIQGIFAYIGYLIFGVSNPVFYAVLTSFATIIPLAGTMIVWIPLSIVFLVNSEWLSAIGLGLYGLIVIGGVDNIARFILQKRLADIHPLITVFGVIFGMAIFGFWGVIFGPLLISLLILFLKMYRHDYVPGSKAQPRITDNERTRSTNQQIERLLDRRSGNNNRRGNFE